jgi:hypothetical protein
MLRTFVAAALAGALATAAFAAPTQREEAEKSADSQDKVICKRFVETGSLVKGYRACKSKRDWERERDAARAQTTTSGSCGQAGSGTSC